MCLHFSLVAYGFFSFVLTLQNLYEDGDEEMKKTIAKAWTDARSGKTADPLKGL